MAKNQRKVGQNKSDIVAQIPAACMDEKAAVEFIEAQRWGKSPVCAHCESDNVYQMTDSKTGERNKRYLWRCRECKKQYTVRIGTVFEDSRIPMRHWCYAFWRACTSKKGVAALEIQRQTGLSYKSALFMMHRIRFAMTNFENRPPMRGVIESDEVWLGGRGNRRFPVVALVQRDGELRAERLSRVTTSNLKQVMKKHVDNEQSHLVTDDLRAYRTIGREFGKGHDWVKHTCKQYSKTIHASDGTEVKVHVNNAESFFAILRRGLHGIWHAVSEQHLHRYISAAQFRFNTRTLEDGERTVEAIRGAVGKRLYYKEPAA